MDFSKKKFIALDCGCGIEHAVKLAESFGHGYYFTPWQERSPRFSRYASGTGMGDLEKVLHWMNYIDKVDLVVILDGSFSDAGEFLRNHKDMPPCFGGGRAEGIEEDRWLLKQIQKKAGLLTQDHELCSGIDELEEHLKSHKNQVVKMSTFRGGRETFKAPDLESVEQLLNELRMDRGPLIDQTDFVPEDELDGFEVGFNSFFNGKDFLYPMDCGHDFLSRVCERDKIPSVLIEVIDKLKPVLAKTNYRGFFAIEGILGKDKKFHLTDTTIRYAYPWSTIYTGVLDNYDEVIWSVANGEDCTPKYKAPYLAVMPAGTPHVKLNWTRLFTPKDMSHVKLLDTVRDSKGHYHGVKEGYVENFALLAWGKSWEKCIEDLNKLREEISADEIERDQLKTLEGLLKETKKSSALGFKL